MKSRYGNWTVGKNSGVALVTGLVFAVGFGSSLARLEPPDGALRHRVSNAPAHAVVDGPHAVWRTSLPELKGRNRVFGDLKEMVASFPVRLAGEGKPEDVMAGAVRASFFKMIGVEPVIGRGFLPREDELGGERVAILSHQLWKRRFAESARIVGHSITLNGAQYEVVGILPPDFTWNDTVTDVWVPYGNAATHEGLGRFLRAQMAHRNHPPESEPAVKRI